MMLVIIMTIIIMTIIQRCELDKVLNQSGYSSTGRERLERHFISGRRPDTTNTSL